MKRTAATTEHFRVGDKAVYPAHGVAEVLGIESREISGAKKKFYILRIVETGLKVMVPTDNVDSVGLRDVITSSEAEEVYEILRTKDVAIDRQTWNRRHREYMEKIKTGSVYEVAEVLRDLSILRTDKDLSFGERKMLDTARALLVRELAVAKHRKEREIEQEIERIFAC
jgi:CarD family transcriptional regulator